MGPWRFQSRVFARPMWRWAISLPMFREPEWSVSQMVSVVSAQSSMKWLPPPRVPHWRMAVCSLADTSTLRSVKRWKWRVSCWRMSPWVFRMGARVVWWLGPTGTAASHAARSGARLLGRSLVVRLVRTAIMPQPMSPPTAAGDTASRMAMTLPMVTAAPTCTSGMMATPWVQGRSATARIWRCAA